MPADAARTPALSAMNQALVLVNLGTPDAPTASAVRRYLGEFLSDRRVVQIPPIFWQPLLRGLILPLRSERVARKYAQIWMAEGSPLAVHTRRLAEAVQQQLPGVHVVHAMRYGSPALAATLQALRQQGAERIVVLPLYPQYSTTTTGAVEDVVLGQSHNDLRVLSDYHVDPAWLGAIADSVRTHWATQGRGERLIFSFHGIPQRLVDGGDPYAAQCEASTAAIAAMLGLARHDILLTYQSRFGRERWLQPYMLPTLQTLARQGVRRVDVVCPGFAVDCLETLEEMTMQNAEAFRDAGGRELRYIPCLNDTLGHVAALAAIAQRAFVSEATP